MIKNMGGNQITKKVRKFPKFEEVKERKNVEDKLYIREVM